MSTTQTMRSFHTSKIPAKENYANIERELLAIVNGCEQFHQYTFGREVFIYPQTSGSYNIEIILCQLPSEASKVTVADSEV